MYTSLGANDFLIVLVTNNHFEPGAYTNTSGITSNKFLSASANDTTLDTYGQVGYQEDRHDIQLFNSMLEGNNTGSGSYEDLTPSQCASLYNTDFISTHRNLFVITSHTSNTTHNNTLLDWAPFKPTASRPMVWMCGYILPDISLAGHECNSDELASNVTRGLPWQMRIGDAGVVEISGCKSEKVMERCKVQFSLGIMMVVICCNLVKACGMVMAVVRSREPTLVTLGDAIDSFLSIRDPTTIGICYADRQLIEKEWRRGWRTGPRQWKQKGVQRWWTSVSKARWITCNFFCSVTIIAAGVLLGLGMHEDGKYGSTDLKSM